MAYYIVAAGGSLYQLSTGGTATTLTLPSGVTFDSTKVARMAVLGRNVCIVNGPSRSVFVDALGTVRPMVLQPPVSPPALAAGTSGAYSGTVQAKYSHVIKDPNSGALLAESALSPASASVTITNTLINVSGIQTSPDPGVTHRRLYRTTTGPGSVYYPWLDLDGNTKTATTDDLSDASLSLLTAPTELGTAAGMLNGTYMSLLVSWKNRLWGVGNNNVDNLLYSGDGMIYGWPGLLPVAPVGADQFGITGLIARRDELGIAKRNVIWKVTGSSPSNFQLIKVIEGKGVYAPDSIAVIRDIGYFLGEDGVYAWGPDGVNSVSDEKVRGWFTTDTYFNRAQFVNAFGKYNARYHTYELHLAAAGSSDIDRWVSYDIARKIWFGPHKTAATTPTLGSQIIDSNNLTVPVIGGSDGYIYQQNQTAFTDSGSAIAFDMVSKAHSGNTPDIHKLWGELGIVQKAQGSAGTCAVSAGIGDLASMTTIALTLDLTTERARYRPLGPGRFCQLEITESTNNQGLEIYGYELPYHELGRR